MPAHGRARGLAVLLALGLATACGGGGGGAEPADDTAPTDGAGAGALGLNDVSVLFPAAGPAELWPASLPGNGGPLLPRAEYERIGLSLVRELEEADEYDALRVVAARFDPCFASELGGACQPQIRLVMQIPDPAGGFFDGAIHTLYALDAATFATVVEELRALARLAPENVGRPLGPSPALAAQGLDGPYARGLRALVTAHAGQASLVRMTFMTRTFARSGQWQFGGFLAGQGKLTIAGVGVTQQNVTRSISHDFEYVVAPEFADPAGRRGASASRLDALDPAARADVHAWALRQQDPAQSLPDTTDCASCHLAGHAARHLEALDASLVTPALAAAHADRTTSLAETDADNLRAFGWFGKEPHVAQRTANETRAVLAALGVTSPR